MSSWLRSAISKAAEVGGRNLAPNITRTVKNAAQHAGHAVVGGAKIVQDRLVGRNLNSSKNAIKRLDEVAQEAKGNERIQALARWLGALKELEKDSKVATEESTPIDGEDPLPQDELPSPTKVATVLFYDFDANGEPMNFREIFLRSHAVENLVSSMIMDAPTDEEINLLSEIFGLCLAGGKELHNAIISSIQDLAKVFSTYNEEIKSKKEYLLQYAKDAVTGLKLSADLEKLEKDIVMLMHNIEEKKAIGFTKENGLNKTKEMLQLDIHLRELLQKKRLLLITGDTEFARVEKIDLLKSLSTLLKQNTSEAEKQIEEYRSQKEEALKYRTAKAHEVNEVEKTVASEVKVLQKRKDELEAQLKEVTAALAAAMKRHINLQEEKQQFDEASTSVVGHLAAEEEELTRSIASQNVEAAVLGTWVSFLEDTWQLQSSCVHKLDESSLNSLIGLKEHFFQTLSMNLLYLQEELKLLVEDLKSKSRAIMENRNERSKITAEEASDLKITQLQETYFEIEGQIVSILRNVEVLRDECQMFNAIPGSSDAENDAIKAFALIDEARKEVEAIDRLNTDEMQDTKPSVQSTEPASTFEHETSAEEFFKNESSHHIQAIAANQGVKADSSQDETEGWEFDELEEELKKEGLS